MTGRWASNPGTRAAPGGKTVQLAWRGAAVTAYEVNPARRRRLEENLQRSGIAGRVAVVAEPETLRDAEGRAVRYDKVLVDAPCSNTGVLRRHPDFAAGASQESIPFETGHDGAFAASFRRQ